MPLVGVLDDSVINLRNASHIVTDVWWEDKDVMGKIKVLDTPAGRILKDLIKSGVKLGISSRGLGSVQESQGNTIVQEDFELICFDLVSSPSTPGAYIFKTLEEKEIYDESLTPQEDTGEQTTSALNGSINLMNKLDNFLSGY